MNSLAKLAKQYDVDQRQLKVSYQNKALQSCPTMTQDVDKATDLLMRGENGYDVIGTYDMIHKELENTALSPILFDIIKEKLTNEYNSVVALQRVVAKQLGYEKPDDVSIHTMIAESKLADMFICSMHFSQFQQYLGKLADIHKKQEKLFISVLKNETEDFDDHFMVMSHDEITQHNEDVQNSIANNSNIYQQDKKYDETVIPNMQLRKDPILDTQC